MKFTFSVITWITAMVFLFSGANATELGKMGSYPRKSTFLEVKEEFKTDFSDYSTYKNDEEELKENIYLVIGVFAIKDNAIKFAEYANKEGFSSRFSLNPDNNLFYVYLKDLPNFEEAVKEREKVIASTSLFPGIWIFKYTQQANEAIAVAASADPAEEEEMAAQEALSPPEEPAIEPEQPILEKVIEEKGYPIFPNAVYIKNYKDIKASVQVIDPVRSKLMTTIDAHEISFLKDPNNGNHTIQLIANAFGYRKVQHDIALNDLDADSLSAFVFQRGDTIVVEFPMERLKTGDIATMYNVFFRNDAAVMESSSKFEINSLLEMLKENPNYNIMIHGHTNGNKRGKIIKLAEEDIDFFNISEVNKRGNGSAKQLSKERALTIKKYLVENGISEDRMDVQGWGGKKMIYDKNGLDAKKNVRVEIEILQD